MHDDIAKGKPTKNSIYLFHFYKKMTLLLLFIINRRIMCYIQSVILILQNSVRKVVKFKEFRKEKCLQLLKN